ncbi:MAG TPA: DUF882 domain-containing protein, partial [Caulobacteraceae bacterium]
MKRRELLKLGLAAGLGAGLSPIFGSGALAQTTAAPAVSTGPRRVLLHNLHTGEALDAVYWDQGSYVPDALASVNKVLRDYRTGDVHAMDPRLLDLLHEVHGRVGAGKPFQVISGYRSPHTNAMLHERSGQVAAHSLHMDGLAIDVRMEGVALDHLHKAALDLQAGGVGLYPTSDFVH